tara:strand:+ start:63 stop:329 length:267 start_codon:yes stop_codon:yes gene_type:complete
LQEPVTISMTPRLKPTIYLRVKKDDTARGPVVHHPTRPSEVPFETGAMQHVRVMGGELQNLSLRLSLNVLHWHEVSNNTERFRQLIVS